MSEEGRPCEACGMRIVFLMNDATGKRIPAQRVRSVYHRDDNDRLHKLTDTESTVYVSHFETCPDAGRFSKKR